MSVAAMEFQLGCSSEVAEVLIPFHMRVKQMLVAEASKQCLRECSLENGEVHTMVGMHELSCNEGPMFNFRLMLMSWQVSTSSCFDSSGTDLYLINHTTSCIRSGRCFVAS